MNPTPTTGCESRYTGGVTATGTRCQLRAGHDGQHEATVYPTTVLNPEPAPMDLAWDDDPSVWPCTWLVRVPSGNPEPDCEADLWTEVECGAPAHDDGAGWTCAAGHSYAGIEAELGAYGLEWQREQAERAGGAA